MNAPITRRDLFAAAALTGLLATLKRGEAAWPQKPKFTAIVDELDAINIRKIVDCAAHIGEEMNYVLYHNDKNTGGAG